MKRTDVYLREQQLEKLQAISKRTGASLAFLIRLAVDKFLNIKKPK
jgi:predicted DNA-binding protein